MGEIAPKNLMAQVIRMQVASHVIPAVALFITQDVD